MDRKEPSGRTPDPIADMAENGQLEHTFATPVFRYVLKNVDSLNAELCDLILERERMKPSMAKSNQGGWQSSPDFFGWGGSVIMTLERYLNAALKIATARVLFPANFSIEFQLYGWAAVNRRGHYNTTHVHPMATWSGVYYVDAGDEPSDSPGAVLEFSHPITASLMTFFPGLLSSARVVRPETGMIILFPSYLQHSVRMYHGSRPRICVPFNAHMRSADQLQKPRGDIGHDNGRSSYRSTSQATCTRRPDVSIATVAPTGERGNAPHWPRSANFTFRSYTNAAHPYKNDVRSPASSASRDDRRARLARG